MWRFRSGGDDILYSVDYNHKREIHLNGAADTSFTTKLFDMKPTLFITSATCYQTLQEKRQARERELKKVVMEHLRNGGDVLLPTHSVTRVLELLMIFEKIWSDEHLPYKVAFLTRVPRLLDYAKSLLEWMNGSLARSFDKSRINRFEFKHIVIAKSVEEVRKLNGPKVCICSSPNLEPGSLSRAIFDDVIGMNAKSCFYSQIGLSTRKVPPSIFWGPLGRKVQPCGFSDG